MEEMTPLLHNFVFVHMHNNKLSVNNYIILKTMLLQREPFLKLLCNVNSSPSRYHNNKFAENDFE